MWYASGDLDEAEIEDEIRRKQQYKAEKGGKFGRIKGKIMRADGK